jgi:serine/threonine protein kinase
MNRDQWDRVESLYHAALTRKSATRGAFLTEACSDEQVRLEVVALLNYDSEAIDFIETPAIEGAAKQMAFDGAVAEEESELAPPAIGPYRLLQLIAKGGMGEVHLAVDTRLNRKVAIKLLPVVTTTDCQRTQRFKQEARAASALNHPNIVMVFEVGDFEGRHYIVTEYVAGETVRQRLNASANGLPVAEAFSIAMQIADALDSAHKAGIVHRDIKPENVMIRQDGLVKILDFGLAKFSREETLEGNLQTEQLVTRTGVVMGTAAYMSPEQARGQKVDHRTDLFSLGALMYEMLSRKQPFAGTTISDVIAAVLVKDPEPLSKIASAVPGALQRIVERCLEKEPDRRFQSASDLSFALHESNTASHSQIETNTSQSTHPSLAETMPSRLRGLAYSRLTLATIAIAVTSLIAITILRSLPAPNLENRLVARVQPQGPDKTQLTWFDRTGRKLGTVGEPAENSGPAFSPTEDLLAVAISDPAHNTRDIWIIQPTSGARSRLTFDSADDFNPRWTPDGKWIIFTSTHNGKRNIYRKLADGTGPVEQLLQGEENLNVEDISSDGQLLIFNYRSSQNDTFASNLGVLTLNGDRRRLPFLATPAREDQARFSPNGRWVAYHSTETGRGEIFVRTLNTSGKDSGDKWLVSTNGGTQPQWRADGKELFYLEGSTLVAVEVNSTGSFSTGSRRLLFNANIEAEERRNRYLATRDGQRFLVVVRAEAPFETTIAAKLN